MTSFRMNYIFCNDCELLASEPSSTDHLPDTTVRELRIEAAKELGWTYKNGRDLCSVHSKKEGK